MPIIPINAVGSKGLIKDTSAVLLPPDAWSDAKNVRFNNGSVEKIKGHQEAFTFSVEPNFVTYWPRPVTPYYVYGDSTNLFRVDAESNIASILPDSYTPSDDGRWQSSLFNGGYTVVLNNQLDAPRYITYGTAGAAQETTVQELPGWINDTTAGVLRPFKNALIAGNITDSSGDTVAYMPGTIRVSSLAAPGNVPSTWTVGIGSTTADEFELSQSQPVHEIVDLRGVGLIFTGDSIHRLSLASGSAPTRVENLNYGYGTLNTNCVTVVENRVLSVDKNDIYTTDGSGAINSISDGRVRDYFFDNLSTDYWDRTFVSNNYPEDEVWICFPKEFDRVDYCTEALIWNYRDDTWTIRTLPNTRAGIVGPETDGVKFLSTSEKMHITGFQTDDIDEQQAAETTGDMTNLAQPATAGSWTWDVSGTANVENAAGVFEVQEIPVSGDLGVDTVGVNEVQVLTASGTRSNVVQVNDINKQLTIKMDDRFDSSLSGGPTSLDTVGGLGVSDLDNLVDIGEFRDLRSVIFDSANSRYIISRDADATAAGNGFTDGLGPLLTTSDFSDVEVVADNLGLSSGAVSIVDIVQDRIIVTGGSEEYVALLSDLTSFTQIDLSDVTDAISIVSIGFYDNRYVALVRTLGLGLRIYHTSTFSSDFAEWTAGPVLSGVTLTLAAINDNGVFIATSDTTLEVSSNNNTVTLSNGFYLTDLFASSFSALNLFASATVTRSLSSSTLSSARASVEQSRLILIQNGATVLVEITDYEGSSLTIHNIANSAARFSRISNIDSNYLLETGSGAPFMIDGSTFNTIQILGPRTISTLYRFVKGEGLPVVAYSTNTTLNQILSTSAFTRISAFQADIDVGDQVYTSSIPLTDFSTDNSNSTQAITQIATAMAALDPAITWDEVVTDSTVMGYQGDAIAKVTFQDNCADPDGLLDDTVVHLLGDFLEGEASLFGVYYPVGNRKSMAATLERGTRFDLASGYSSSLDTDEGSVTFTGTSSEPLTFSIRAGSTVGFFSDSTLTDITEFFPELFDETDGNETQITFSDGDASISVVGSVGFPPRLKIRWKDQDIYTGTSESQEFGFSVDGSIFDNGSAQIGAIVGSNTASHASFRVLDQISTRLSSEFSAMIDPSDFNSILIDGTTQDPFSIWYEANRSFSTTVENFSSFSFDLSSDESLGNSTLANSGFPLLFNTSDSSNETSLGAVSDGSAAKIVLPLLGEVAGKSVTLGLGTPVAINPSMTIVRNSGTHIAFELLETDGQAAYGTATTYTIRDYSGAEITSFVSSVPDEDSTDLSTVLTTIEGAIDSNTETPIDFTASITDSVITLSAGTHGAVGGLWDINVNHHDQVLNPGDILFSTTETTAGVTQTYFSGVAIPVAPDGSSQLVLTGQTTAPTTAAETLQNFVDDFTSDDWTASINDTPGITFTATNNGPVEGLWSITSPHLTIGDGVETTAGQVPTELSNLEIDLAGGSQVIQVQLSSGETPDQVGASLVGSSLVGAEATYDADANELTLTALADGLMNRPTITVTNSVNNTDPLVFTGTGSDTSGTELFDTPSVITFTAPTSFSPTTVVYESENEDTIELLGSLRDAINAETFSPVDITATTTGNELTIFWKGLSVSDTNLFSVTVDHQGGNGDIEFESTVNIPVGDLTSDRLHTADITFSFNGADIPCHVSRNNLNLGDLQATTLAGSIYPLMSGEGEVNVCYEGTDAAGKVIDFDEDCRTLTFDIDRDYKLSKRAKGRFLNVRFGTEDSLNWNLDSYSFDAEAEDKR